MLPYRISVTRHGGTRRSWDDIHNFGQRHSELKLLDKGIHENVAFSLCRP